MCLRLETRGILIGDVLGEKANFFPVEGAEHGFDTMLFLGDPKLEVVREAWEEALDEIVKQKIAGSEEG